MHIERRRLLEVIALYDPSLNCRRRGSPADWDGLPESNSLFLSPQGCGLPIGTVAVLARFYTAHLYFEIIIIIFAMFHRIMIDNK